MLVDLRRVCHRRFLASAAWAAIGLLLAGTPHTACAAGVVGTGTPDSCTDAALDVALAGGGLVTFDCGGPATIDISTGTGTKTIAVDTTIDGAGVATISGGNLAFTGGNTGNNVRVFSVNAGVTFTVQNLTVANGLAEGGGAILNNGMLTIANSTFSNNYANFNGRGGGAILNNGMLTVANSTFSNNVAGYPGGGAILNNGMLAVTNSTFVRNRAFNGCECASAGGAIDSVGSSDELTVINSTFFDNQASYLGGAICGFGHISNSIIAGTNGYYECCAQLIDDGHNIDSNDGLCFTGTGCTGPTGPTDPSGSSFCNTNPQLDPRGLANNGGPTQTIALGSCSPAINAGDPAICANPPVSGVDQRGLARPAVGHTQCSIGAYEADAVPASCCVGDCDSNSSVAINELVLGVDIVLGVQPVGACPAFLTPSGGVDIAQLITAVNNELGGCGLG